MAGSQRKPDDRRRQDHRAVQAGELRQARHRDQRRRSQGLPAPWTVKLNHTIVLDTELLPAVCLENEKSLAHIK